MKRLAIMDWGIGGLGCWREWKRRRPEDNILYFSDSGYTPYGKVPTSELVTRLLSVLLWMREEMAVSHVIIACNAASTVIDRLEESRELASARWPIIMGVVRPAVDLVRSAIPPQEPLAIIGGARTIRSGIFPRLLAGHALQQRIAQPLSALVEAGRLDGPEVEHVVTRILQPLRRCRHLLLACTHYVALSPTLSRLRPDMRIWDPIPYMVAQAATRWQRELKLTAGPDLFITTGSPMAMAASAVKAFGLSISAEHVPLTLPDRVQIT